MRRSGKKSELYKNKKRNASKGFFRVTDFGATEMSEHCYHKNENVHIIKRLLIT